ncbi:MAG: hypothetical protein E4H21_09295 [Thermodesulfobacteriales bacterium]|nr:MAG: hypothetical protein E4H21_09295 [Thermodesulfobacteriales bacterium]
MIKKSIKSGIIFVALGILFVVLPSSARAGEECAVIAEKLVKPDAVSAEFDVPKTKVNSVKLSVEQSPIELKTVKIHYNNRADDEYNDLGTLQPGEQTKAFDAPGIKKVKITGVTVLYQFPDDKSEGAVIQVLGCK